MEEYFPIRRMVEALLLLLKSKGTEAGVVFKMVTKEVQRVIFKSTLEF